MLLEAENPSNLAIPFLQRRPTTETVQTKYGAFPKGSVIGIQQKLHSDFALNIYDGVDFPNLPVRNMMCDYAWVARNTYEMMSKEGIHLELDDIYQIEKKTQLQSESPLWHKIRSNRITASKIHDIYVRKVNFESLVLRLKSTGHRATQAMKDGLADEPKAASKYEEIRKRQVNIYPCGLVINYWTPWVAASPDRKVYDPTRQDPF